MATTNEVAKLKAFERQARTLLANVGRFGEEYDSARLAEAMGHLSQAADALYAAHIVRAAQLGKPIVRERVYLTIEGPDAAWITAKDRDISIPIFTYQDYLKVCGEAKLVQCSSSMDFPEEQTSRPDVIKLAHEIRG